MTERVLTGVDEIADVQAGRLRDLHRALSELADHGDMGFDYVESEVLADRVRTVFDVHERFTTELTQFFAELNLWQSRYDLDADEVQLFAGVLVTYVSEQLREIERMVRPISTCLERNPPPARCPAPGPAERSGGSGGRCRPRRYGERAEVAGDNDRGLGAPGGVVRGPSGTGVAPGSTHPPGGGRGAYPHRQRDPPVPRVGLGAVSRRADFVRLAGFFDQAGLDTGRHTRSPPLRSG